VKAKFYIIQAVIKVQQKKIYWYFLYPLAAVTFVVVSALFILSARGYGIHFEKNGVSIEKTGMIIVSSKPAGASIYLNGKDTSKKTTNFFTVKINNLGKNKYILTIEKDGYYKWEKELKVFPEMVTWANYVLLFSKNPKIDKVDFSGSYVDSLTSKDDKYSAVLVRSDAGEVLYGLDNKSGEKNTLLESAKMSEDARVTDIKMIDWSKDHKNILISGSTKNGNQYFVLNIETKNIEQIAAITPTKFDRIIFSTANNDDLYGTFGKELFRVNVRTKSVSTALENNVVYFTFSPDGKVYYIKDDAGKRSLWQGGGDLGDKTNFFDAVPVSDGYTIKVTSKDQKVALKTNTDLSLYFITKVGDKNSLISVSKNITDFDWSKDGERIFYKSREANIIVFEFDDYRKESKEYEITGSQVMGNLVWYDSRHLLAYKDSQALVMDFDGTNQVSLGNAVPGKIFFGDDNGDIFFFSQVNANKAVLSKYKVEF